MSKGQRGNKEAKKPKKAQPTAPLVLPSDRMPGVTAVASGAPKKK